MGALEEGPLPGIEDTSAPATAIIDDRITIRILDMRFFSSMTTRAMQARGMEQVDKEFITLIFIH
jgi:hypothetical protein